MKAVILVGGEGTRLHPLTKTIPKPLIDFMNRPFLDHVLDHLAAYGVSEAILSSSFLEEEFAEFLRARRGGPAITWITETVPLGTAGAIRGARERLDGTFLVLNGDVLTDLDLDELVAAHRDRKAVATIALTPVDDARPFGLVDTAPDGRVLAFREKPAEEIPGNVNAGTYVLEPLALDGVRPGVPVSIERETFPGLIARGEPVYASASEVYWRDLGTPAAYVQAHVDALDGRVAAYRGWPRPLVARDARVAGGAEVGEHVVLGSGASVGRGSRVDRSVLHRGAWIGEDAVVEGSILGPDSAVEAGAVLREAVLAEGARVQAGVRLDGAGVAPGEVAAR